MKISKKMLILLIACCLLFSLPCGLVAQKTLSVEEKEAVSAIRGLFNDKLYDLSLSESDKFLENFPKSSFVPEVFYIQATSFFYKGQEEQTVKKFKDLLNRYPLSSFTEDAMFRLGLALYNQGRYREAYDNGELLLIQFPNGKYKKKIQFNRIKILHSLNKNDRLVNTFEVYRKLNLFPETDKPNQDFLNYYYALSLGQVGRTEESVVLIKKLLKSDLPEEYRTVLDIQLVKIEQKNGDSRQRQVLFQKLKDYYNSPQSLRLFDIEIAADYVGGKADVSGLGVSIDFLEKDLSEHKDSSTPEVMFILGRLYSQVGKNEQATEVFRRLQIEYPEVAKQRQVSLYLVHIYEKSGNIDEVLAQLFRSLKNARRPNESNKILFKIAKYYLDENEPKKALEQLNLAEYSPENPQNAKYEFLKATASFFLKDYSATIEHFEKISEQTPEYPLIFNEYFIALIENKTPEKFLKFFKNHSEKIPREKRKEAIHLKYRIYFEQNFCEQGLKEKDEMLAFEPGFKKDPAFYRFIGDCALKSGQDKQFTDAYWTAFKIYPETDTEKKLALADELSRHYQKKNNFRGLADVYRLSIPLIKNEKLKNQSRLYLGKIWENQLENSKKAIPWYRSLQKFSNTEEGREAAYLLAEIYIRQKKINSSLSVLVKVSKTLGKDSKWYTLIFYRLGQIYQSKQDWNNALRSYRQVLKKKSTISENKDSLKQVLSIKEYLKSLK